MSEIERSRLKEVLIRNSIPPTHTVAIRPIIRRLPADDIQSSTGVSPNIPVDIVSNGIARLYPFIAIAIMATRVVMAQ